MSIASAEDLRDDARAAGTEARPQQDQRTEKRSKGQNRRTAKASPTSQPSAATYTDGYVFIEGEYLPPPYHIRFQDGHTTINGREVRARLPRWDRPWRGGQADEVATAEELGVNLEMGGVILSFADQPLVVLSNLIDRHRLLLELLGEPPIQPVALVESLPKDFDRQVWDDWRREFRMSPQFRKRAEADVAAVRAQMDASLAAVAANRRLNQFSYPLTVCGMIATVLGVGHLLSHRPPTCGSPLDTDASPTALSVASWSLMLIIGLSALDLTWTILASQAGQMRELNPLGSGMIEDPSMLSLFKGGTTLLAVGLLFGLRKYRRAQLAAWWLCLLLTMLTARWVMLNSMFVAA